MKEGEWYYLSSKLSGSTDKEIIEITGIDLAIDPDNKKKLTVFYKYVFNPRFNLTHSRPARSFRQMQRNTTKVPTLVRKLLERRKIKKTKVT